MKAEIKKLEPQKNVKAQPLSKPIITKSSSVSWESVIMMIMLFGYMLYYAYTHLC